MPRAVRTSAIGSCLSSSAVLIAKRPPVISGCPRSTDLWCSQADRSAGRLQALVGSAKRSQAESIVLLARGKPALAPAYGVMAPVPGVRLIGPRWTTYHWPRQEISEKIPKEPSLPTTVL